MENQLKSNNKVQKEEKNNVNQEKKQILEKPTKLPLLKIQKN